MIYTNMDMDTVSGNYMRFTKMGDITICVPDDLYYLNGLHEDLSFSITENGYPRIIPEENTRLFLMLVGKAIYRFQDDSELLINTENGYYDYYDDRFIKEEDAIVVEVTGKECVYCCRHLDRDDQFFVVRNSAVYQTDIDELEFVYTDVLHKRVPFKLDYMGFAAINIDEWELVS